MATLLVLGSKPDPFLPPPASYAALACANASGRSALRLGLPSPAFTVMSSVLAAEKNPSNHLALEALAGLETRTVYYCPRQMYRRDPLKRMLHARKILACRPRAFERRLRAIGYRFSAFVAKPLEEYMAAVTAVCGDDPEMSRVLARKHPSTGVLAVVLASAELDYDKVILSGFSFEITHAYADNPVIRTRGSPASRHADTDVAVLARISERYGNLLTTEPIVAERAGIPLISAASYTN